MITPSAWTAWLNSHPTFVTYNENAERVKELCKAADGKKNFDTLTGHKNIVLLTKPALGAKCQASFFHSSIGCAILPDDMHHCARIGMESGTGMEVDPKSLFQQTEAIHKPSLLDLMKASTPAEFENIKADESKSKRKVS